MALDSFETTNTSSPPLHNYLEHDSWRQAKHSKRESDDVDCLAGRNGGDPSPTAVEKQKELSPFTFHAPPQINSYKCNICEKAFASHQALGGHKACHRSKPPTAAKKPSTAASSYTNTGGIHKCSKCGNGFSNGQALGGHMRKHYIGGNGNSSSLVTSSSSERGDSSYCSNDDDNDDDDTCIPRKFDLNLAPPSELDLTLKL